MNLSIFEATGVQDVIILIFTINYRYSAITFISYRHLYLDIMLLFLHSFCPDDVNNASKINPWLCSRLLVIYRINW